MKDIREIEQEQLVTVIEKSIDGGAAYVRLQTGKKTPALVVFSYGGGWEHVSVSYKYRCPTWEEMCKIKDIFWYDDDCVVQYHPPKADYVNQHPYCLHLWRPVGGGIIRPPAIMVGLKGGQE